MQYANHEKRVFCGISNQITSDDPKPERTRTQIRPVMARMWIADEHVKRVLNVI
jgi:hypothetical protein